MAESLGEAVLHLRTDDSKLDDGIDRARTKAQAAARDFQRVGGQMQRVGARLSLALTVPIIGAGAAAIKLAGDFEAAMIRVGINSQATGVELGHLRDLAREIGKDTVFSATEAADAMDMLAKNGVAVADILNGAARAAVNLAAATGSDLAPAANTVTDVMKQFGIVIGDLPRTVDLITGAVNQSKMDFSDFSAAIAQGGAVAASTGLSFEDFNAALAGTSSMFAGGSDAGTSFKAFLSGLTPISSTARDAIRDMGLRFFDAQGQMLPLAEIAQNLRDKLGGLSEEARSGALQNIFGTDGMRTAIGLMNLGADGLNRIKTKIGETDAAAQSAQRMQGFNGQLEQLGGALQDLAISIGDTGILTGLTNMARGAADFISRMAEASPTATGFGLAIAGIVAVVGPLIGVVGMLASGWGTLIGAFGAAAAGGGTTAAVLGAIGSAALPVVAVVAALVAAWMLFGDKIGPVLSVLWTKVQEVLGPKVIALFNQVKAALTELWNGPFGTAIKAVIDVLGTFAASYLSVLGEGLIRTIGAAVDIVSGAFGLIVDAVKLVVAVLSGDWAGAWNAAKNLVSTVISTVLNVIDDLVPGARRTITNLASGFATWFGDLAGQMVNYGRHIVQGLVDGILAAPQAVLNALLSIVHSGIAGVRKLLDMHSPSRLFMQMGGFITDGLALGIAGGHGTVSAAMADLARIVSEQGFVLPSVPALDVPDGAQFGAGGDQGAPSGDTAQQWRDGFKSWFSDGIKAAFSGDLGGFLEQTLDSLLSRVLDSAVSSLVDQLFSGAGGSGGGLLGALGGLFGSMFGGAHALGGTIPQGKVGLVGERGPELAIATPRGTVVRPNRSLSDSLRPSSPAFYMPIHIDATGADPAALERVRGEIARMRSELPATIVSTVQDASDRRFLR